MHDPQKTLRMAQHWNSKKDLPEAMIHTITSPYKNKSCSCGSSVLCALRR